VHTKRSSSANLIAFRCWKVCLISTILGEGGVYSSLHNVYSIRGVKRRRSSLRNVYTSRCVKRRRRRRNN